MGTLFKRSNPDIDAYLQHEQRARARRLEAFAIEALELGMAFEETALPTDEQQEAPALRGQTPLTSSRSS
jgi:hypothetical protein